MACDGVDEKTRLSAHDDIEGQEVLESTATGNNRAQDEMQGRARPWQELRGDEGVEDEKTAKSGGSDHGVGDTALAAKRGTSDEIAAIEMEERTTRARQTGAGPPAPAGSASAVADADGAGPASRTAGEYKVYKRRWFGLVQLTLLNIIVSWDWLTFAPVAGQAARYFNTDETTVNWLSTAFMFASASITPVVIYILHLGPKPSIMASAALILVGNWIRFAGAHSGSGGLFGVVMFGQILLGLAQPFVLAAPTRYSDLWFTNRGRVAATALTSLANPLGAALGQLVVPLWVTQPSEVSSMLLYVSVISSVCAIPSFFIPAAPPTPVAPSGETPKMSLRASAKVLSSQVEFWLLFVPFAIYVGLFNAISSLLNQIMLPHGYTADEAGLAGAVLILVGLCAAAASSPIIDRTRAYLAAIRLAVPVVGASYLTFIFMPRTKPSAGVAGPYAVMALLGASSFALVPVVVEFLAELTHPVGPEVTSSLAWAGGQLLGGVFIVVCGALRAGEGAEPPSDMTNALVFMAVVACAAVPVPLCLGLFGRGERLVLRRVRSDEGGRGE